MVKKSGGTFSGTVELDTKYIAIAVNGLKQLAEDLRVSRMVALDIANHLADLTGEAIIEQEKGGKR